jgi:Peptidase family M1 domain/Omp85 superfamily domain
VRITAALLVVILVHGAGPARADVPNWLPRYDLDMRVDVDAHRLQVYERVTWTNRHETASGKLVFNAHSHYQLPAADVALNAKTLEMLRVEPGDAMEDSAMPPPLQVQKVTLNGRELAFRYQEENNTALEVILPDTVSQGQSVTIEIAFDFRLPQKQGRWGQWKGITFLATWLPVLAVYDDANGWQPTPFIPWHQPFFNEAGIYTVRALLPRDQEVACTAEIARVQDLGNGLKQVEFFPICSRDFAFLCSACYQEFRGEVEGVQIRCMARPEHAHYAQQMIRWVCEALPVYNRWFGPYPYRQFTIAESYFGWNGNECGGLVMIDERVFNMPHMAGAFVEYLISHEFCHQWWYNAVGTNGYCETWMDEGLATYFSHLLMDKKHGKNALIDYPRWLEWLPNIERENYRYVGLYGTIGRGKAGPTVQAMPTYGHLVNLLSMCYDRGSKVVGMICDRLGEDAFFDFMRGVYARYQFRILRVADYQRELEAYTGASWDEFFRHWLYGAGMSDWCVEKVTLTPANDPLPDSPARFSLLDALRGRLPGQPGPCRAVILLRQKADYNEQTVLGIALDGSPHYQIRIPIQPQVSLLELAEPPARVEVLSANCVRVEVLLPCEPTQISVDPDQVLVDRNPANNHWKPNIRYRFSPLYTPLEETEFTNDYDRWNALFGFGVFGQFYNDPWYNASYILGLRAALFRTADFRGGVYAGYRTDYEDLVVGADGLWQHWPWPNTEVGFNVERRLTGFGDNEERNGDRGVLFGRYIIKGQYTSSLYLPPMHYVEVFGTIQDNQLPFPEQTVPGANHFDDQTAFGIHYHVDYLTPYWDPAAGFRFDTTYETGVPIFGEHEPFNWVNAQLSFVKGLPDQLGPVPLGPLSETRLAARLYGAVASPTNGEFFPLGGSTLFRGFDLDQRQGSLVWIGSLEWRIPVARRVEWDVYDHLAGVRDVWIAPFYDVGNAYLDGHEIGPVAHALGIGLRVNVAILSLIERSTLRFDVAKTVNASTPWQFWFGFVQPF